MPYIIQLKLMSMKMCSDWLTTRSKQGITPIMNTGWFQIMQIRMNKKVHSGITFMTSRWKTYTNGFLLNGWNVQKWRFLFFSLSLNPVQAWIFFRPYFHYCLSSAHHCEDHFHSWQNWHCWHIQRSALSSLSLISSISWIPPLYF